MATISSNRINTGNSKTVVMSWPSMAIGDEGQAFEFCQYADRSVQVTGTFGAGGTVRVEGSIDGTNWAVLTDPQGNDLNITASKIEAIVELVLFIRPRIVGGDGTTLLNVTMIMKE